MCNFACKKNCPCERQMTLEVMEWAKKFAGQTITIKVAENGNIRFWSTDEKQPFLAVEGRAD